MSEQEMNRKMGFIIEQQAQFVVDIQKLYEGQKEIQKAQTDMTLKHNHLTEALTTMVGMIGKLSQGQEELQASQKRTDERIELLAGKLGDTNERLNVFIDVLERFINQKNGNG
jgi:peptidoglycan hydrolase CwlO-like protein